MQKGVSMNQKHQKAVEKRTGSTTKKAQVRMPEKKRIPNPSKYDIELPQSIIDSFARFLVPEIRKYYDSERGQKEFTEWTIKQNELSNRNIIK